MTNPYPFRFRRRPVIIEAVRIPPPNDQTSTAPMWVADAMRDGNLKVMKDGSVIIKNIEGSVSGEIGEWIIRDEKGCLDICTPEEFESRYESVNDGSIAI